MSPENLASLFDRAGGKRTETMGDAIAKIKLNFVHGHADHPISEVPAIWDHGMLGKQRSLGKMTCSTMTPFTTGSWYHSSPAIAAGKAKRRVQQLLTWMRIIKWIRRNFWSFSSGPWISNLISRIRKNYWKKPFTRELSQQCMTRLLSRNVTQRQNRALKNN